MSDWRLKLEEPEWALRERFIKVHSPLHNQEWCNALDLMLGMIADARDQAIAERDEARRALAECERERDALKAGKWAGAWEPGTRADCEVRIPAGYGPRVALSAVFKTVTGWHWNAGTGLGTCPTMDEAKAASDAHVSEGFWLDGGAHKAGEAK